MTARQIFWLRSSFAFLLFVFLGYVVRFYPQNLVTFDSQIQTFVRGSLPEFLTAFFKTVTVLGNPEVQIGLVVVLFLFFYLIKGWKIEGFYQVFNGLMAGLLILVLKNLYQRPRPSLEHLVHAGGYSFPSGHSLGAMLIFGTVMIVLRQRFKGRSWLPLVQLALAGLIILIGLSRIYLGVHYPSDVLAGFALGYGLLNLTYPIYDQKRFEWRFQGKQV